VSELTDRGRASAEQEPGRWSRPSGRRSPTSPRRSLASEPRPPASDPRSPTSPPRSRISWKGIGWLPVWLVLGGYFVWMCTSMAGEAPNGIGGSSLIALLVAVAAGLIAGGLALGAGRRQGG
jgi:hypothetical protein